MRNPLYIKGSHKVVSSVQDYKLLISISSTSLGTIHSTSAFTLAYVLDQKFKLPEVDKVSSSLRAIWGLKRD